MNGVDDVIERVISDLFKYLLSSKHTEFSWSTQDKQVIVAAELGDVIIDMSCKDLILITNPSENWSIIRFRKSDAPKITYPLMTAIREKKIEDYVLDRCKIMTYEFEGSVDDIMAWCIVTKLKLF